MFKWLFGEKCDHDFQILKTTHDTYWDDDICKYKTWRRYVLYCPKCDKEKRVDADSYDLEQEKQQLKDRYRRFNKY
jgi:hypothetical protein